MTSDDIVPQEMSKEKLEQVIQAIQQGWGFMSREEIEFRKLLYSPVVVRELVQHIKYLEQREE